MTEGIVQDNGSDSCSGCVPEFPEPSPQEAMFFFNMIKNMSNQPEIDWDGVATDSGFKNAAVAKKRFYQIKQKLGLDSRSGTPAAKSPRKPRVSKAAAPAVAAANGAAPKESNMETAPRVTKRRRTTAAAAVTPEKGPVALGRRAGSASSDSGPNGRGSSSASDNGLVGCITVGVLKTEDNEDDEEDDGI